MVLAGLEQRKVVRLEVAGEEAVRARVLGVVPSCPLRGGVEVPTRLQTTSNPATSTSRSPASALCASCRTWKDSCASVPLISFAQAEGQTSPALSVMYRCSSSAAFPGRTTRVVERPLRTEAERSVRIVQVEERTRPIEAFGRVDDHDVDLAVAEVLHIAVRRIGHGLAHPFRFRLRHRRPKADAASTTGVIMSALLGVRTPRISKAEAVVGTSARGVQSVCRHVAGSWHAVSVGFVRGERRAAPGPGARRRQRGRRAEDALRIGRRNEVRADRRLDIARELVEERIELPEQVVVFPGRRQSAVPIREARSRNSAHVRYSSDVG